MSTPLQPLGDYVVAVAEEAETKTASGMYLPEKAAEKPKTAKVVAVGPKPSRLRKATGLSIRAIARPKLSW